MCIQVMKKKSCVIDPVNISFATQTLCSNISHLAWMFVDIFFF